MGCYNPLVISLAKSLHASHEVISRVILGPPHNICLNFEKSCFSPVMDSDTIKNSEFCLCTLKKTFHVSFEPVTEVIIIQCA